MPELPEVETVKAGLSDRVVGLTVESVEIRLPSLIRGHTPVEFIHILTDAKITGVNRRAKMLILNTSKGDLVVHLKMSGRFIYCEKGCIEEKHTRAIFYLDNGFQLRFADMRKFGFFRLVEGNALKIAPELQELGPEPLEMSLKEFKTRLGSKRKSVRSLKLTLIDQKFIVGIGNLYADEILFVAKLLPTRKIGSLTDDEIRSLLSSIKNVLKEAIRNGGTTFDLFVDSSGSKGSHQENLQVYQRQSRECYVCNSPIKKVKLGGRGTHFCGECQI